MLPYVATYHWDLLWYDGNGLGKEMKSEFDIWYEKNYHTVRKTNADGTITESLFTTAHNMWVGDLTIDNRDGDNKHTYRGASGRVITLKDVDGKRVLT